MVKHVRSWWMSNPRRALFVTLAATLALVLVGVGIAYAVIGQPAVTASSTTCNATASYTCTIRYQVADNPVDRVIVVFPANTDLSNVTSADVTTTAWGNNPGPITEFTKTVGPGGTQRLNVRFTTACADTLQAARGIIVSDVRNPSHPGSAYSYDIGVWNNTTREDNTQTVTYPTAPAAFTANATAPSVGSVTMSDTTEAVATTYTVPITVGANGRVEASPTPAGVRTPDEVVLTFDAAYTLPTASSTASVTLNGVNTTATSDDTSKRVVIQVPSAVSVPYSGSATVGFKRSFGLVNPAAGSYSISATTSPEANSGTSAAYTITPAAGATRITIESSRTPAAAIVARSETTPVAGFSLQRTQGSALETVTALTIDNTGTAPATNISAVYIYRDDGDKVYDGGDALLNAGGDTFTGSQSAITLDSGEPVDATARLYWVAYTFASGATDGAVASARLSALTHTADNLTNNAVVGNTFTVDALGPVTTITDPSVDGTTLVGASKTIQGTAADARSTVASVTLSVRRASDGWWWTGATWTSTATTLGVTGTGTWSYAWTLPSNDGTETYTLTAVGVDTKGNVGAIDQYTNIKVDNVAPTVVSASSIDNTHAAIVFSERVTTATAETVGNYSIPGLTVSAAVLQPDGVTVRLTTTSQTGGSYTATVSNVTDMFAHTIGSPNSATFTGTPAGATPTRITIESSRTPAAAVVARSNTTAVAGFSLQRTQGSDLETVTALTIDDTGTAPATNISAVYIYRDDGDKVYDGGDALLNAGGDTFTGSQSAIALDSGEPVDATARLYWVVYTFASGATDGAVASAKLTALTHTADNLTNNAVVGNTFTVDALGPVTTITDPSIDGTTLVGASKTIQGTATDARSTVASVTLSVRRASDGWWWTGATWTSTATTLGVTGTAAWSRAWTLPSNDGTDTYTLTAVGVDSKGNVGAIDQYTNIKVDNVSPTVVSASSSANTSVSVVFSERVTTATAQTTTNYNIPGLTVTGAVLQADGKTVILVTTSQSAISYTVTVSNVTDMFAHTIGSPNSANFTGNAGPDTIPPTTPTGAAATSGTAYPTIATVTWNASTDAVGVMGYTIYRNTTNSTTTASAIGNSTVLTSDDITGVSGVTYYYWVRAYDAAGNTSGYSNTAGPITATWTNLPHVTYTDATEYCRVCHVPHDAATQDKIFVEATSTSVGELEVCYSCHDGTGASTNIMSGPSNSFATTSGHILEDRIDTTTVGDLSNACSSCHTPHKDYNGRESLWASQVGSPPVAVTGRNNTWCYACHDNANTWYTNKFKTAYPPLTTPTVDASGYPTFGTFPGPAVYASSTADAHSRIPSASGESTRVLGDCLWCHASHASRSRFDSLLATFQVPATATVTRDRLFGDYAGSCLDCHDGSWTASGAVDVKRHTTYNGASDTAYSGHRIKSATPSMPINAPLPCFYCHNPHGSSRGNKSLLADTLGGSLDVTAGASATEVRQFCLTCHTTWDGPYGWDSVTATYYPAVGVTETVAGLRRDGGALGSGPGGSGYNWLRLKNVTGHLRADTGQNCYTCHGSDYSSAGAYNVHDPGPGLSPGGVECYACHPAYKPMDKFDPARANTYHHVMGTSTTSYSGGYAPGAVNANYPTSASTLFCVTCHTDHNFFNANKAANLRVSPVFASGAATNTDFSPGGGGGTCTTCHGMMAGKDNTGNRTSDGSVLALPVSPAEYDNSAHEYEATSTFSDGSVFRANCSKCHNDEMTKSYQSGRQFGTHMSDERHLLAAFGAPVTDPLGQDHCFGCHSRTTDGRKTTAKRDYWNASAMTTDAEFTQRNFGLTGSSHPVTATGGAFMGCESCHNVHKSTLATPVADPDNSVNATAWVTAADKVNFCLDCHDGAPPVPVLSNSPYTYVASLTIPAADSALVNKGIWGGRGHWSASGSISAAQVVRCDQCHDNHGSKTDKLLGEYDPASDSNRIYGPTTSTITANDDTVCYVCHTRPSTGYPVYVRASGPDTGYPTEGTWSGATTYAIAYNPTAHTGSFHTTATVSWPTSVGPVWPAGDCKNCHDVHGSANPWDELRTESTSGVDNVYRFRRNNYGFCFNCHDSNGPAQANSDIKRYYPTTASGTLDPAAYPRAGHRTVTTGTMLPGSTLPCYDCHNPHGSGSAYGLHIVTRSKGVTVVVGERSGEITMTPSRTNGDIRRFCLACHTTNNTALGWTGTATEAVDPGDLFEGIDRSSLTGLLRLPPVSGHYDTDGDSCYKCHGNDYSGSGTTNVHNPSGGVSDGNQDCYSCHADYKPMDRFDPARANSYHHIMGTSTTSYSGGYAPGAVDANYPTSSSPMFCVSCHADHSEFNSNKAANLRISPIASSNAATNTDYSLCNQCHGIMSFSKDNSGNRKTDGTAWTLIVPSAYATSAHSYAATSGFSDGSVFRAECSKCHNDGMDQGYQTPNAFGTHLGPERHLLSAFGVTPVDPLGPNHCFGCHSRQADGRKATARRDYYNASSMTTASEHLQRAFTLGGSSHPVTASGGAYVGCESCHSPHIASETTKLVDPGNSYVATSYVTFNERLSFCFDCHDGATPVGTMTATAYVASATIPSADATAMNKSYASGRAHWSASGSIASTEVVGCDECHDKHGATAPKLLGSYDATTGTNRIYGPATATITANDNSVCYACHNPVSTGYPISSENSSGYPVSGTWTGETTYTIAYNPVTHRGSIHVTGTASWPTSVSTAYTGGDCKNCHDVHGTANLMDELRTESTAGVAGKYSYTPYDFSFCFNCHDANGPGADNIAQYYPTTASGTADPVAKARSGHRTRATATGTLGPNRALPCYDCHNPHGTGNASSYGLLVVTRSRGVTIAIGDGANEIEMTGTPAPYAVRRFCFTCHTSADTAAGWTGTTTEVVLATDVVEGISRTATAPLRLPDVNGHRNADADSCYKCHGRDYLDANSTNVHSPSGGISLGGTSCYGCHAQYKPMDMADAGKTSAYHHVMGSSTVTYNGDYAPGATGSYPGGTVELLCVSCHGDHDKFNTAKGANLRQSIASAATTNTDYSTALPSGGLCVSCHTNLLSRDTTNQKADATGTAVIDSVKYDQSGHDYSVASSYGVTASDRFLANCSKCHNDQMDKDYQPANSDTDQTFGTHIGDDRDLLSAFGATGWTDPYSERHCYKCHSRSGEYGKTVNLRDIFGADGSVMTSQSEYVYDNFAGMTSAGSSHPIQAGRVECVSCHNTHVSTKGATKTVQPNNTYVGIQFASGVATEAAYCINCHDGAPPVRTLSAVTYIPATVTVNSADSNKNTYRLRGHWEASGSISTAEVVSCADCHDSHGSNAPKLLGSYDMTTGTNKIYGPATATITANDNSVCYACHNPASTGYPISSENASGYPVNGTWTGQTTYTVTYDPVTHRGSIHVTGTASWPTSVSTAYTGGDCKNCHDVHGTANLMDELRTESTAGVAGKYSYTPYDFSFCFNCHDANGPGADNIAQYYPTTASGTADPVAKARSGHRTRANATGTLGPNRALPCYDCHNPHGTGNASSYGLLVVTRSRGVTIAIGDGANEIEMTGTPAPYAVRRFCFTCHTSADTAAGWNGVTTEVVLATDTVEGISRTATEPLRLPNVAGHRNADINDSCYTCHGRTYTDANSVNVHNPSGGVSQGGEECYSCHDYSQMDDASGSNTNSYHHVLGTSTTVLTGDYAPGATGAYPSTRQDVLCVSCHTDHNYFNGSTATSPAANLRVSIALGGNQATNTDFIASGSPSYGVCLSCHDQTLTRDNTNQKAGGAARVVTISPSGYAASAHNYSALGTLGASAFRANCLKCHDDENTGSKFPGTNKFGLHYSAETTLLAAMGVSISSTGSSYPRLCYKCHGLSNPNRSARLDWYAAFVMTRTASWIETDFADTFKHPLARGSHANTESTAAGWNVGTTRHSTCMDCHNVHEAKRGTTKLPYAGSVRASETVPPLGGALYGVWGVNISSASAAGTWTGAGTTRTPTPPTYSYVATVSYQWQMCLKCHSRYAWSGGTTPTVSLDTNNASGQQQTDVGADFNPAMTSFHPLFKQGSNQPPAGANGNWNTSAGRRTISGSNLGNGLSNTLVDGWRSSSLVVCTDCHGNQDVSGATGPHGSDNRWLMRGKDAGIKVTNAAGTALTPNAAAGNAANFCINCHRYDVYSGTGTYANLSRFLHTGCSRIYDPPDSTYYFFALPQVGCYHCHGARPYTDGVRSSGTLHGSNRQATGYRMLNGASWGLSHQYEDMGAGLPDGAANCQTIGSGDTYSSCAQHGGGRGSDGVTYYYNSRR